jgi:hypothetical protein
MPRAVEGLPTRVRVASLRGTSSSIPGAGLKKGGEISVEKEEQKKAKKKINLKVRDIVPKKDAKGGSASSDPCEGGRVKRP